jgi:hypothetical protein
MSTHENFTDQGEKTSGSDRNFGLVFAVVFMAISVYPMLDGESLLEVPAGISAFFLVLALTAPCFLGPLNRLWTKFGLLISTIMNPVILGVIFLIVLTPLALGMKLAGKDPLRLKLDAKSSSYWIDRTPPGPEPISMEQQF